MEDLFWVLEYTKKIKIDKGTLVEHEKRTVKWYFGTVIKFEILNLSIGEWKYYVGNDGFKNNLIIY